MATALSSLTSKLSQRLGMGSDNGEELINILKATAFKGQNNTAPTDAQLMALLIVADQYGLNPWTKEIYAYPDKKNGIVPVVGVDGWARIINSHPQFDGMEFSYSDELVQMPSAASKAPAWIECSMFRKDRTRPVVVREYLDECYREPFKGQYGVVNGPWQSHPKRFLRHKAYIQCGRIAFGYTGIYDQDEAERILEKDMGDADVLPAATQANSFMPSAKPAALPADIPHDKVPEAVPAQPVAQPAARQAERPAPRQAEAPAEQKKSEPPAEGVPTLQPGMIRVARTKMEQHGRAEADVVAHFGVTALEEIPVSKVNELLKYIDKGE